MGTEICCSVASQVHEYLCLSESSSRRYGQTGFTVLLGTIAVKTLLPEDFFPVVWALSISFPVHYSTAIVSLGLFLAAEQIIILPLDKTPQKSSLMTV